MINYQRARIWTPKEDAKIRAMRADGKRWDDIAKVVGGNRTASIVRGRQLGLAGRVIAAAQPPEPPGAVDVRLPMPAGSAVSWGAISSEPWPVDLSA